MNTVTTQRKLKNKNKDIFLVETINILLSDFLMDDTIQKSKGFTQIFTFQGQVGTPEPCAIVIILSR